MYYNLKILYVIIIYIIYINIYIILYIYIYVCMYVYMYMQWLHPLFASKKSAIAICQCRSLALLRTCLTRQTSPHRGPYAAVCYQRLGRSHCFVSSYVLSRKDQRWSKIKDFLMASCLKHIDTKDTCSCLWRNDTAMIAAVHHLNWDLVSSDSGLYPSTLINWGRLSAQP